MKAETPLPVLGAVVLIKLHLFELPKCPVRYRVLMAATDIVRPQLCSLVRPTTAATSSEAQYLRQTEQAPGGADFSWFMNILKSAPF